MNMNDVDSSDAVTTQPVDTSTDANIETIFSKLEELNVLSKWFNRQGKAIIRKHTKSVRRRTSNSNQKSGFAVPVQVAETLAKFLELDPNQNIPRTEVTKKLTVYIKAKNLQCEENKKHFICDEALAKVFSVPTGTQTNWFEMQKFLAKLLTSVKKDNGDDMKENIPPNTQETNAEAPKKKIKKVV